MLARCSAPPRRKDCRFDYAAVALVAKLLTLLSAQREVIMSEGDIRFTDVAIDELSDEDVKRIFTRSVEASVLRSLLKSAVRSTVAFSSLRSALRSVLRSPGR